MAINWEDLPDLILHVRKEYFDQIKSGPKTEEYRLIKPYWTQRLCGPPGGAAHYRYVRVFCGYPSKDHKEKQIVFAYDGYTTPTITHKEFGDLPVQVYAIRLIQKLRRDNPALSQ
ncbi:MAG: hypothetical protein WC598_00320 [Methanoregula sp.]